MLSHWTTLGKWTCFVLACLSICILAAAPFEGEPGSIIELNYEDLADEEISGLYQSWKGLESAIQVDYYYRDKPYGNTVLHLQTDHINLRGAYQFADQKTANLQVVVHDRLTIGNYRLALGEGLIFSRGNKSGVLKSPPHPKNYSPQGIALDVGLSNWRAMGIISHTKRAVRLSEGKISYLPKAKQDYLSTSLENIYAVALWRNWNFGHTGMIYYHQRYDKGFVSADQDSLLQIVGLFAQANFGIHRLSMETAIQSTQPSLRAEWNMHAGKFRQKWRFTHLGKYQRPAYASKAALLTSIDQRDEIMAELSYLFRPGLEMNLATVQNKRLGDLTDSSGLSHNNLQIRAWNTDSKISLNLKIIDREVLAAVDSSYVHSIPLHYRVILSGAHDISENWWLDFAARYHYQEKQASLSSGSFWRQGIGYRYAGFDAWVGISIFNNTNYRMIILDDSDEGYETLGTNSLRLELKTSLKHKYGRFTLRGRQDLKKDMNTTIDLSISMAL
nr:hypothetical protein [Candidatus Cloacimonadota bacterium]